MGTQFWWFYDVLTLTIAVGLLYNAAAKGFNKLVFRLIGSVLAFVVGIFGSGALAEPAYNMLFREEIATAIQAEYESMDLYGEVTAYLRTAHPDSSLGNTDREQFLQNEGAMLDAAEFTEAAQAVIQPVLSRRMSPYPMVSMQEYFASGDDLSRQHFLAAAQGDHAASAEYLEKGYFRPYYLKMIRMALFLILGAVVLIIVGIISAMTGNLEHLMHIRRFDKLLAVPVGLIEAAFVLIALAVAVKLVVMGTEDMMLLFNQDTIEKTKLFQLLYEKI